MNNLKKETLLKIANTLPIGFYLGRRIAVDFDDTSSASYYSPMEDKIKISLRMIQDIIERESTEDKLEFEKDLRCLLYHEISHVILTPKNLMDYALYSQREILNIFEDTRIETILKNYYRLVNFEKFVRKVNNFNYQMPKDALDLFYQVVRYNVGNQRLLDMKQNIIKSYLDMSSQKANGNTMKRYIRDIQELYDECEKEFDNMQKQMQNQENQESQENQDSNDNANGSNNGSKNKGKGNNQKSSKKAKKSQNNESNDNDEDDESSNDVENAQNSNDGNEEKESFNKGNELINKEELMKMVKEIFKKMSSEDNMDTKLYNKLKEIIIKRKGKGNRPSGSLNYNGRRLNTKAYIKPNTDYKWFERKVGGSIQNQDKIRINLYIDNSGSFEHNDRKMNSILMALKKIERELTDIEFTLTTIANRVIEKELNKDFIFQSGGGTRLDDSIGGIVRKNNNTKNNRINIVMFDGQAGYSYNFRHFNDNKSIIIYEEENKYAVEKYAPRAFKTFVEQNEFTDKLSESIISGLYRVLG